jgi:hypothetical protein
MALFIQIKRNVVQQRPGFQQPSGAGVQTVFGAGGVKYAQCQICHMAGVRQIKLVSLRQRFHRVLCVLRNIHRCRLKHTLRNPAGFGGRTRFGRGQPGGSTRYF